jgi:hypothetical protein
VGINKESIMAEHKNIYAALIAAQSEFGTVIKGATNPAFKSKYADLSDVASVVIPTLNRHGVAVAHYMTQAGAMRTEFAHAATGSRIWCDVPLIVDKQNMHGFKSATTYAKRIGLESLSGVAPEDDDGNAAAAAPPKQQGRQKPVEKPAAITEAQLEELQLLFTHLGVPVKAFLDVAKVADLAQLPAAWFDRAKVWVNDQAKAKRDAPSMGEQIDDEIAF